MRRVNADEVQDLADLFLTGNLTHPIDLTVDAVTFAAADIGPSVPEYDGRMQSRMMKGPDGTEAIQVNGRPGWLALMVGQWSDQPDNEQVVLSSGRKELDPRFGQINLNLSLTDGRTVYLVKNLSKDGGEGSIRRLYGGASGHEMRHERATRRNQLAISLGNGTISFEGEEWLIVAVVPLRIPRRRADALFTEALVQILRYAAQVERLRHGARGEEEEETHGGGVPCRLSAAERKLIESEAMSVVRDHLEAQDYRVTDVADRQSYDFEARRGAHMRFIEVKGTTSRPISVELTAPEHRVAKRERDRYTMYVVLFESLERLDRFELVEVGNPIGNPAFDIAPVRFRVRER